MRMEMVEATPTIQVTTTGHPPAHPNAPVGHTHPSGEIEHASKEGIDAGLGCDLTSILTQLVMYG